MHWLIHLCHGVVVSAQLYYLGVTVSLTDLVSWLRLKLERCR